MATRKTTTRATAPHTRRARKQVADTTPPIVANTPAAPMAAKALTIDTSAKKKRKKPVRDSFTMPPADFALIATLKQRALASHRETKKSELLRAGLHALAQLDGTGLVAALHRLQPVKLGRPKTGA